MAEKPTYEELAEKVKALEQEKLEGSLMKEARIHADQWPTHKFISEVNPKSQIPDRGLGAIINAQEIQSIMDDFGYLTQMTTAILDLKGNVIEATGWQDICTHFHRKNPQTAHNCTGSDLFLAKNLKPGEHVGYKCKNGLWDVVTPLYVGSRHLGNIYTGQFFYDDEPIDEAFFIKQAEVYGFDKDSYLDAFRRIPQYNRETIDHLMSFLVKFTSYISRISLLNMQLENEGQQRRQVQAALKESEIQLRTFIRTIPDLVWLKDPQGVILFCNSKFETLYGAREKDIVGKTDYDFVGKALADSYRKHDQAAMAKGGPVINEEEVAFADDGHREIIETIKTPIYRSGGQLVGVLGIGRDITERKRAEEARESLMSAIEQSSETIVITDTEGTIRYVNPAFEKITGYTRGETIGRNPRFLKSGEQDESFYRGMWETISAGRNWRGRFINKKKDGSLFIEDASISPVVDASGAIVNYVSVRRDITEQLRVDGEKFHLEEQYRQAQKVESIGRLAGGVAHDLNNMLAPILGYGEMLLDDFGANDYRRNHVEQIVQAGLRARDLVHQLLAFSRKQPLEYKPVDINQAIIRFERLMRRTIREDIEIKHILTPGALVIMADIGQVEQVIMNLAVNASDAMPEGGCLIIETALTDLDDNYALIHQDVKPGQYVMLSVSDTGCGMDDHTREHLFEPFFSTKGEQGTGLGLSTVYGIVKQHDGNIWVYSEPGAGTSIKIYLPVSGEPYVDEDIVKNIGNDQKGFETILLVEDNVQVRRLAHAILKRYGYTVLVARNGSEALAILAAHEDPVDLLFTDVVMPEMNGKELFTKAAERLPGLKVLYMSGYTNRVIAHRGVLDEGVQFIQKPFGVKALVAKVRQVLDQS